MNGNTIKEIRKKLLMTQLEFSSAINISLATIQKWEQNMNNPSFKYQRKILDFCKQNNINIEDIENKYED